MEVKSRNSGVELLRIVSMIMIVTLHYLYNGKILNTNTFSTTWTVSWFIEALCIVAVNCYVLISGYFLVKAEFKIKKIIILWLQVEFYSISIFLILISAGMIPFNLKSTMIAFTPISSGAASYWFVSSYIGLYLLSPFLNLLINSISKKKLEYFIFTILIMFCVWPTLYPFSNILDTNNGYGIIWFVCLYFVAGYVRVYIAENSFPQKNSLMIYLAMSLIIFLSKIVITYITSITGFGETMTNTLYKYNSIVTFISSFSLFVFFLNINIKNTLLNKIILIISPFTFGVYLIHEHFALRQLLWSEIIVPLRYVSLWYFPLISICIILAIFISCVFIDFLWKISFGKIGKSKSVTTISDKIENYLRGTIDMISAKANYPR